MSDDKVTQALYLGARDAVSENVKRNSDMCFKLNIAAMIINVIEISLLTAILWRVWGGA